MTFAYVKEEALDPPRGTDKWISVLVVDEANGIVVADDNRSYEVEVDALVDAQEWMLGDPIEVLLGDNELTMEEAIEFAGEDVRGKTRFHRLATDPDNFEGAYGKVMWR